MKIRYYFIVIVFVFTGMIIYGLVQKNTYTDYNSDKSPLEDNFTIGIFPDELVDMEIDILNGSLDSQNYILAVTCTQKPYFRFGCVTQSVVVEKIFAGDDIKIGNEISVIVANEIYCDEQCNGKNTLNMSFTNVMTVGQTYLIFLDKKIDNHDSSDLVYNYSEELLIEPIFCYEDVECAPLQTEDEAGNFCSYSKCCDYEFFMDSQESLDKMIDLKNEFINKYPLG